MPQQLTVGLFLLTFWPKIKVSVAEFPPPPQPHLHSHPTPLFSSVSLSLSLSKPLFFSFENLDSWHCEHALSGVEAFKGHILSIFHSFILQHSATPPPPLSLSLSLSLFSSPLTTLTHGIVRMHYLVWKLLKAIYQVFIHSFFSIKQGKGYGRQSGGGGNVWVAEGFWPQQSSPWGCV